MPKRKDGWELPNADSFYTTLHMLGSCHRLGFWKQMLRCSLVHNVYSRFQRQEDEVSASGRERNKTM